MLLPHRHTFFGRWLTRRLTPTGPSHLLLFLDTSAINTKLPKAVNTAEGSLRYGGGMLGGYLPRAPSPCLIPWRFCPWVPIYLFSSFCCVTALVLNLLNSWLFFSEARSFLYTETQKRNWQDRELHEDQTSNIFFSKLLTSSRRVRPGGHRRDRNPST